MSYTAYTYKIYTYKISTASSHNQNTTPTLEIATKSPLWKLQGNLGVGGQIS